MLTALLAGLLGSQQAVAASVDGKQQELSELRERIQQLKDELEQAAEDRTEVADALKASETNISQISQTLRKLQAEARRLGAELQRLERERQATEAARTRHASALTELLRQRYYLQGSEEAPRLLLGTKSPGESQRKLEYLSYIGHARADLIAAHRQTLEQLQTLASHMETRRTELATVTEERLTQKKTLEAEKLAREGVLNKLSEQIRQQRKEISTLVRDEQRLTSLIKRLQALAARPSKKPANAGQKVGGVATAALADFEFPKLRGKLALPVPGEITARFGQDREGGGPDWKGLFIRAKSGQEVRAVGTGEVVFSDWLRGFGNLLIIDHGEGYLSLYSNNESLYKQPGDRVKAGDIVAAVGNTGGQESAGLYFELRHQGKPFDPMTWVASR